MEQTVAVQSPPKAIRASLSREEAEKLDNQALLERYKETGDPDLKWMLVLRYTDLVRKVASQATGIYSSFAQLDDVVQEGLLVLLGAVDKFDPTQNVKFETYVSKRLRGMILDLARKQDSTLFLIGQMGRPARCARRSPGSTGRWRSCPSSWAGNRRARKWRIIWG